MSVSVISRARDLALLGDQIEAKQEELVAMRNQFTALSKEVHALASSSSKNSDTTVAATTSATTKTGRRGRPPGSVNKNKATTSATTKTGRRGRPPGSVNKNKAVNANKVSASERNYSNEMSLRAAVWDVMDRKPAEWRKILGDDLPADVTGLKVSDIKNIIEAEKKWTSSSENISPQVQQAVYTLKNDGKVSRGDDKRYSIVKGAKLDG
jgi:hypothetical protein